MYTPWVNLLLASGAAHSTTAVDKALSSTVHTVNSSVQTIHTIAQTTSQWDILRKDLADTMRDILRPVYDWCIDDTLVSSSVLTSPSPPPTFSPSTFWNVQTRSSSAPSASSFPEPLPTSSAAPLRKRAPLPKRVPLPTPHSRPQPNAVVGGSGSWLIAPPTATPPSSSTRSANIHTSTSTHNPRLGPVAMPRAAYSPPHPHPSPPCASNFFIGPRLPTSPIGSFNGTELPVPGYTCSPDDRPPKPRYIWTRRPRCPFDNGDLPEHIVCPMPVSLSEHKSIFLDPPGDPRDPIIDLGPALDSIPLYFESILAQEPWPLQPVQRTMPIHDSTWFRVVAVALTFLFVYVLYLGPPGEDFDRVDLFDAAVDVVVTQYHAGSAKIEEILTTFPPLFPPDGIAAAEQTFAPEATAAAIEIVRINRWSRVKQIAADFFAGITHIVITSWLSVIGAIECLFAGITRVVVSIRNIFTMMVESIINVIVGFFIGLWNTLKGICVVISRVVIGTFVTAKYIVKGSFRMAKDIITRVSRFPQRRVTEQPTSHSVIPSPDVSNPPDISTKSPTVNPTNDQAAEQHETAPSSSQSPVRLRSLPPGVADAIRAGNATPSQVRRAGRRRVNMARPVRATTPSSDH